MDSNNVNVMPFETLSVTQTATDLIPAGLTQIRTVDFWNLEPTKGEGIKIAVLDTGCDVNHPDLQGRIAGVRNFTLDDGGNPNIVTDYVGHGTHVSGTIAANENRSGVIGVAPRASLYIIKVLSKDGGNVDSLINGINYAISLKVDIISMSLGSSVDDPRLSTAVKAAIAQNIAVVCAAGNSGDNNFRTNEYSYPAAYPDSICVGSVGSTMVPSVFTDSNDRIDVAAPGEKILSTYPGGKYAELSGTSMATPHVTGAIALLKKWARTKYGRDLTEIELYNHLIRKTVDINYDSRFVGYGVVNLLANRG